MILNWQHYLFLLTSIVFLDAIKDVRQYTLQEVKNAIINEYQLSDKDITEMVPSGRQTLLSNRIGWTRTYLKKAGAIKSPKRAEFIITDIGKRLLSENPHGINNKVLMQFSRFKDFVKLQQSEVSVENAEENNTPQEIMDNSFKQINNSLADELLEEIINQTPLFFESLVIKLLLRMGYGGELESSGTLTKQSNDEGIDGIIKEDKLGFELIYIQAKKWDMEKTINRPEVQKFVGALVGQGAKKGLFITTAKFSPGAYEYSNKQHTAKVVLIDGQLLTKYMIEFNLGVSTEQVYEVKKIDTDFFNELI